MTSSRGPFPGLPGMILLSGLLLALQAVLGLAARLLARFTGDFWLSPFSMGLFSLVSVGIVIFAGCVWAHRRTGDSAAALLSWNRKIEARRWLALGVVLSAFGGSVVLGELSNWTAAIWPIPSVFQDLFARLVPSQFDAGSVFLLAFVAPLTEELLFRGLFLTGASRRYGPATAAFLTSSLFALVHLNPWQAVGAFVAGFYLAWLTRASRHILPAMAAHSLFNFLPIALLWSGVTIGGYNDLPGHTPFQPPLWVALGALCLAVGVGVTFRALPRAGNLGENSAEKNPLEQ